MQKTTLIRSGVLSFVLAITSAAALAAQDRGAEQPVYHDLGYGTEPGQAMIFILPADVDVGGEGAFLSPADIKDSAIEITATSTRRAAVGNCHTGEVRFQPARIISRTGKRPPVETELAVLYPDNALVPTAVQLGAFRPGGPCGPGFQIQRAHVLSTSY